MIFTTLSSKPVICSSSVALLLIPCSVILSFQLLYCSSVCLYFSSSRSFLNISCLFSTYASRFSPRCWIIFTSLLWILFPLDCLCPLHLVVLLGFYLIPSSGMHSFPVSFCLTFCDCSFYSTGFRAAIILAFVTWNWVGEAKMLMQASWSEEPVSVHWWVLVLAPWWAGPCSGC